MKIKYFQWRQIVEINLTGRKKHHLHSNPHNSDKGECEQEDVTLFGQLLNTLELKIQYLVIYTLTVEEM